MGIVDLEGGTFSYWDDGEQPTPPPRSTRLEPVAQFCRRRRLTLKQLHAEIQDATGRTLQIRELGTADDLLAEIERRRPTVKNPFEYASLQYRWAMIIGMGKLQDLSNSDYPDIKPTSISLFLTGRS